LTAPIQLQNVKPWLVPNCDPSNTAPANANCGGRAFFVRSDIDGSIANNGSFIGETVGFRRTNAGTAPTLATVPALKTGFYALDVPVSPAPVCPSTSAISCGAVGSDDYIDNIACSSQYQFKCGDTIGTGDPVTLLAGPNLGTHTREGGRCLIHASNDDVGQGQDSFLAAAGPTPPVTITGGDNNPNTSLQAVINISRSDSVVTVPLYDGGCVGAACTPTKPTKTIVGFLQLGITRIVPPGGGPTPPHFEAVILNAAGCNPGATNPTVSGGGISTLPARLISPP
jgi:hypothetical protein